MTVYSDCSIGLSAVEAAFGTNTTVDSWLPFLPDGVAIDWDPTFLEGSGLEVGLVGLRASRAPVLPGRQLTGITLPQELYSKGQGKVFKSALGVVATTQRATTGVYQQNHTPLVSDPMDSRTVQVGIPPRDGGATLPHTFPGCVCDSLEITVSNAELVTVKSSWVGKEVLTATSYAAPSYPTGIEVLQFAGANITLGGTVTPATTTVLATGGTAVTNIRDFSVKYENNIDDAGFNIGGGGKRSRRPARGMVTVTGKITAEFDSVTLRDAYLAQTDLPLVITISGANVIGTGSDVAALQIHIPTIRLRGKLPEPGKDGPAVQDIDFKAYNDGTNPLMRLSYVSTDIAP